MKQAFLYVAYLLFLATMIAPTMILPSPKATGAIGAAPAAISANSGFPRCGIAAEGQELRIWAEPVYESEILARVQLGDYLIVTDDVLRADGCFWWPVEKDGIRGYLLMTPIVPVECPGERVK